MGKNPDLPELMGSLPHDVPANVVLPKKIRRRHSIVHIRQHTPKAMYKDGYVSPSKKEDRLVTWIGQFKAMPKPAIPVPEISSASPEPAAKVVPKRVIPSDIHVRFTEVMAALDDPPIEKKQLITLMADFLTSPKKGFDEWYLDKAKETGRPVSERKGFLKELFKNYLHRVMQTKPEGLPIVERGKIQRIIAFWEETGFVSVGRLGLSFEKPKDELAL